MGDAGGGDQARARRDARGGRLPDRGGLPPALRRLHQRAVAHRVPGHAPPDLLAHRVGAIGLIESASYISDMKGTVEQGKYLTFKEERLAVNIGFDPLGFGKDSDLRSEELTVGRIAMLGIAGMVLQEVNTGGYLSQVY